MPRSCHDRAGTTRTGFKVFLKGLAISQPVSYSCGAHTIGGQWSWLHFGHKIWSLTQNPEIL